MSMTKLGKILTFTNGKTFKANDWKQSGYPIIRIQNLNKADAEFNYYQGELDKQVVINFGDLLFSWSGSIGTSFGPHIWERELGVLNQHIFKIGFDSKKADKKYLFYALLELTKEIERSAHGGVGLVHVKKSDLNNFEIPFPHLEIQRQTAVILEKVDNLRKQSQKLEEELNVLTQSVFLEMFGDPMVNSKKFPIGTIRDLVLSVNYGTSAKASENKGRYPILRMNNIAYNGDWNFTALKYVDIEDHDSEKYLVKKGDLLFNRTNSKELVGKTAVYREESNMVIAGYLIRVRCNRNANAEYISGYLNSIHGKSTLKHMCKSIVGMANINAQELQNIKILLPPKILQDKYAEFVASLLLQKHLNLKLKNELDFLFNGLLKKAFKGELDLNSTHASSKTEMQER